ncbi:MAG: outer membrane protein [Xanthobacteraceae bacterium]
MRRIATALLASASLLGLATIASAADLPMVRKAPPPPPPPMWSWTGFYIGAHVGAGWSTTEADITSITIGPIAVAGFNLPLSSHNNNGFLGGGQVGFNWQMGPLVFGVEADASATDIKGHAPCLVVFRCETSHDWLVTAAGRVGLAAMSQTLLYVKGGAAWAQTDYSASLSLAGVNIRGAVNDNNRVGALFGAGIEQGVWGGWSAKIEYNYIDFGTHTYNVPITITGLPIGITARTDITEKMHVVKAGLNYRFGGFGGGPVIAAY